MPTTSHIDPKHKSIVDQTYAGMRIDQYLSQIFPYSRSFFQHLFERDAVLLNDQPTKKSTKLKTWDIVHIESLERFVDGGILAEAQRISLDIHHETADYLVLWKPAGVLSHPSSIRDLQTPSVVAFVYHQYHNLPTQWHFVRAWLLHRLDKDTSWRMIIAKTERGLAYFKELFQQKSLADGILAKESVPLTKGYQARCRPTPAWFERLGQIWDQLPYYIDEDVIPRTPHPMIKRGISCIEAIEPVPSSHPQQTKDKKNLTEITIRLHLLTGRTHQIRYHLSHHGCPIIGDYLYGWGDRESLALCAYRLAFVDPDGMRQEFVQEKTS